MKSRRKGGGTCRDERKLKRNLEVEELGNTSDLMTPVTN
jgi:hypothetical protein